MGRMQALSIALLGAWIMSTLCMWFAATRSFATVESVLKHAEPQFVETTKPLAEGSARVVLRYMAAEINRSLFWGYGVLQIGLGAVLCLIVVRRTPRLALDTGVAAIMLLLAIILTLGLTPRIVAVGRSIDFLPRNPPPPVMPRFRMLHGAFTTLDGLKLLTGTGLLLRWILFRT